MKDDIVIPAWQIASTNTQVKIFNFFPSLLSTIYLFFLLLYQVAWTYIYIFDLKDEFFSGVISFAHSGYFGKSIAFFAIFLLLFIFVVPLAQWGLITMIDRIDRKHEHPSFGSWIAEWLRHFLPIFESNNILAMFKLLSIITFAIFLIRLFGVRYIGYISMGIGMFFLIAMVVNIFLSYTRFFIVLEGKKAFDAVVASSSMALDNMGVTIKLYLTLLLVYIRTIITALLFVILPFLLSAILTYVTIASIKILFLFIAFVLIGVFVVFIAHLNSVLEIFVETLWYRAYRDNKSRAPLHAHDSHHDHSHHEYSHDTDHGHWSVSAEHSHH